jgi:hypothetical protein
LVIRHHGTKAMQHVSAVHIHSLLLWRISKPPVDDETRWL